MFGSETINPVNSSVLQAELNLYSKLIMGNTDVGKWTLHPFLEQPGFAATFSTLPEAGLDQAKWIVKDHEELEVFLFRNMVQDAAEKISFVSGDWR